MSCLSGIILSSLNDKSVSNKVENLNISQHNSGLDTLKSEEKTTHFLPPFCTKTEPKMASILLVFVWYRTPWLYICVSVLVLATIWRTSIIHPAPSTQRTVFQYRIFSPVSVYKARITKIGLSKTIQSTELISNSLLVMRKTMTTRANDWTPD